MAINPSFSDITYFLEVAETKNISRAAERLGITQPSLSTAIQRLESSIDTQLLIRSRSGVQLTKAGKEFLGRGRMLLLNWDQIKADIHKNNTSVSGEFVIGCHPSVALYTLPHFLPNILQQYPNLDIKLEHDLSRKITEAVISYSIDFGIVVNPVKHPDLVIRELCTDDVMFWTASKPSKTQDLESDNCVLICDTNLIQVQKLLNGATKKKQSFRRVIQSSNLEVITELTASGAGIGILPARVATRLPSQKLKPLKGSLPVFKDHICVVYRADSQKSKGAQEILASIKKSIR